MNHGNYPLTVTETLRASFALLNRTLLPYTGMLLGLAGAAFMVALFAATALGAQAETMNLALGLLMIASLSLVSLAALRMAVDAHSGKTPSAWNALSESFRLSGAWVITNALVLVSVTFLTFFLLLPGLYFGVCWALISCVSVCEERAYLGALERSHDLVRHHWWHAAGVTTASQALVIGATLAPTALGLHALGATLIALPLQVLAGAFSAAIGAVLYADLRARQSQAEDRAQPFDSSAGACLTQSQLQTGVRARDVRTSTVPTTAYGCFGK